ncbi:hypothetical protein Lepto7376_0347 [[Leptolyngbya] sp. PCC 7376]|uniref:DUF4079 domain-containing protein n=1 Tax=[Leptolyngbya] sp. PCC 7376 TaxID=111781 RepID=UPI00029ED207|nr:DUF4079 domain-containing protein [[Leptolyngbya] sp. PCC 7376]AFY36786.1 hypothetical protein Lepto7376_0347 [[Leptolyngbya] sp. PCC 7376]
MAIPESVKVWSQFAHPAMMWVLFGLAIYAMYLGFQSRRTRSAEKEVRKELIKKQFGFKHHQIGAALLAFMVLGTIGGMTVTYINNDKLFVGPHLIVGLAMTGIIAVSASLTPFMQRGNELARITHIGLNTALVGLFGWQAISGMDIVTKIIGRM